MWTFEEQSKFLNPILARPTNRHCADCGNTTPTWASLDFGVFICSNCSGAHRALGPTITRVKSTNLDLWQRHWADNMHIGNNQINQYWEADIQNAKLRKPKLGSNLDQYNRYVREKYVRKKFVKDVTGLDPVTAFKNGIYNTVQQETISEPPQEKPAQLMPTQEKPKQTKSANFNLLDDLDEDDIVNPVTVQATNRATRQENYSNKQQHDQDEFDDFVQPEVLPQRKSETSLHNHSNLTYQQLLKGPQLQSHHSQPPPMNNQQLSFNQLQQQQKQLQQQQTQTNKFPQNPPHFIHNSYANHAQSNYQNYHHNPYVGYVPHYNGMAPSNNYHMNQQQQNTHNTMAMNMNMNGHYHPNNSMQNNNMQNGYTQHVQQPQGLNYQGFTLN